MADLPDPSSIRRMRARLLAFYDTRRRDLPWRRDADPYRVWVSEVMLQQTRVETVIPYFERWIERFPDVEALARAERDEVMAAWAGLGYYRRARHLHDAARIVRDAHDGEVPDTVEGLRELPGVGSYTAGAVASIAYDRVAPAVDGNARRVLARLFDLARPTGARYRDLAAALVDRERPGDFNQAVMELGATVCRPRDPECASCPLEDACLARERGTVDQRPAPRPATKVPSYRVGTAVVERPDGRCLLVRRPEEGLLGGTWEFPGHVARDGEDAVVAARRAAGAIVDVSSIDGRAMPRVARVDHVFSHRRHAYHAFRLRLEASAAPDPDRGGWTGAAWVFAAELDEYGLPTAQRKIASRVFFSDS